MKQIVKDFGDIASKAKKERETVNRKHFRNFNLIFINSENKKKNHI